MATSPDFDIDLQYRHINDQFIADTYDTPVGGLTHTERTARDRAIMQAQVLSAVSFAIVPELTNDEIKERMSDVSEAVEKGKNRALTDAQQLITTAFSLGLMDAVDTSVDNGVSGKNTWVAVLDGKTRPEHANEDGDARNEETGLFTLSNGSTLEQPRLIGRGSAGLGDIIRCRCRMLFQPEGVEPSPRSAKKEDGSWEEVHGDTTWEEWSKTIEGERTIDGEKIYRKIRAKRLSARRASLRDGATPEVNLTTVSGTPRFDDNRQLIVDRLEDKKWFDNLTEDEKLRVLQYTRENGSVEVNSMLRTGGLTKPEDDFLFPNQIQKTNTQIDEINSVINKYNLTDDIVTYRSPGADFMDDIINMDVGDVFVDRGFQSTSLTPTQFLPSTVNGVNYRMEIFVPRGSSVAPIYDLSEFRNEFEVLFQNGLELVKVGERIEGTTHFIIFGVR